MATAVSIQMNKELEGPESPVVKEGDVIRAKQDEIGEEDFAILETQKKAMAYIEAHPLLLRFLKVQDGKEFPVPTGERMHQLATLFEIGGLGLQRDAKEAMQFHVFAAELGHIGSRCLLGEYYEQGTVVRRNAKKAKECYKIAAKARNPRGQFNLARIYFYGLLGSRPNKKSARTLWQAAAEAGHIPSITALGYMHEKGLPDLKRDAEEAAKYYLAAAHRGCPRAAFNLGRLYELGHISADNADNRERALLFYKRASGIDQARIRMAKLSTSDQGKPHPYKEQKPLPLPTWFAPPTALDLHSTGKDELLASSETENDDDDDDDDDDQMAHPTPPKTTADPPSESAPQATPIITMASS